MIIRTTSEWLADERNILLVNEKGDVNLFEYEREGLYTGHFFYNSRGQDALKVAKEMLVHIFSYDEVQALRGLTPVDKLGAKWLTRKLGFKSYGEIDTPPGRCELFILTKQQYEKGDK